MEHHCFSSLREKNLMRGDRAKFRASLRGLVEEIGCPSPTNAKLTTNVFQEEAAAACCHP
jgi:hypothetical protein